MKRFYEFIILTQQEFNLDVPLAEFEYDDYRNWGLVDLDTLKILFLGDNKNNNGIEDEIDAFLEGISYIGGSYCLETGCLVLDYTNGVNIEEVKKKIEKGEMYDGVL